jgi:hypothetical protein
VYEGNGHGSISWPHLASYFVHQTSGTGKDAQQATDAEGGF